VARFQAAPKESHVLIVKRIFRYLNNREVSHVRYQRRRYESENLQGELRKIKPPTFDGEIKKGDDAKA
jgi:hypothetical protein